LGEIISIYINWKHLGKVLQPNQIWQNFHSIWVITYTRASMKFGCN